MKYSEDFKQRVLKLYPKHRRMLRALELGAIDVGRLLCYDCGSGGVAFDIILKANTLEEVQKLAKEGKQKYELYKEWCYLRQD